MRYSLLISRWASVVGVHRIAHAGPVGLEEVAGGGDDFEAEEEEVADGELGEVGVEADDQAVEGDGGEGEEGDGEEVGGVVVEGAEDDGGGEAEAAVGGFPGAEACGEGGGAPDEGEGRGG